MKRQMKALLGSGLLALISILIQREPTRPAAATPEA